MHPKQYQKLLDQVSRSFAFCIKELDEPLREWVGLGYLLCRLIDTVEDHNWPNRNEQLRAFDLLDGFLQSAPGEGAYREFAQMFKDLKPGEAELMREGRALLLDFQNLSADAKTKMSDPIRSMLLGMRRYQAGRKEEFALRDEKDLNRDCFFVAGVVGELLEGLFTLLQPAGYRERTLEAIHFGLFLQKINILKDQVEDRKEGRFFIPPDLDILASLRFDAKTAQQYFLTLPRQDGGFRLFCAWSFFLALQTVDVALAQKQGRGRKPTRPEVWASLQMVRLRLHDEKWLREKAESYKWLDTSAPTIGRTPVQADVGWRDLYFGHVSSEQLQSIGVFL